MCLCCLRPDEVAKVLPQSGQAWARAPTCWERMCRCRLLGSVNTCKRKHLQCAEPSGKEQKERLLGAVLSLGAGYGMVPKPSHSPKPKPKPSHSASHSPSRKPSHSPSPRHKPSHSPSPRALQQKLPTFTQFSHSKRFPLS